MINQKSTHSARHSTLRGEPSGSDSKSSGLMVSEAEPSKIKNQKLGYESGPSTSLRAFDSPLINKWPKAMSERSESNG